MEMVRDDEELDSTSSPRRSGEHARELLVY